ncbi:MAG: hypothetical protein QM791_23440 [Ferruginibacter sp.]
MKGQERFTFFLNQLKTLLEKAAKQKNPALWLYRNNARTPLFMLEALAKLYSGIHNKKKFTKIKEHFKLLEDALGAIDYYDATAKDLAANKKIPAAITSYLQAEYREKIQHLNEILTEKKWINADENRISRISKKLEDAGWLDEKEETAAINEFYGEAIYDISEFVAETKLHFDNIEEDVHELRRKLRWLSIYPQALRGCIQLAQPKTSFKHLAKYCTKEITGSPFNKLPDAGDCTYLLLLDQNYFYALSWMIAELGKIKDEGLHFVAVKEALQATAPAADKELDKKAYQLLGSKQTKLQTLLDNAEAICKTYFGEQNLEHLVIGVRAVK